MQIVVNCETRLCSQFLGHGDNVFAKLWCDFYGSGSHRIGQSDGTDEYQPADEAILNLVVYLDLSLDRG